MFSVFLFVVYLFHLYSSSQLYSIFAYVLNLCDWASSFSVRNQMKTLRTSYKPYNFALSNLNAFIERAIKLEFIVKYLAHRLVLCIKFIDISFLGTWMTAKNDYFCFAYRWSKSLKSWRKNLTRNLNDFPLSVVITVVGDLVSINKLDTI